MDIQRPPVPTLLAVGAVHHHLIRTGLRTETSIVADTSQCFSTHQVCTLVGYGAHAVCPYLALETARQWRASPRCCPDRFSKFIFPFPLQSLLPFVYVVF
jgi:glutamate synthase (ferredoxin)